MVKNLFIFGLGKDLEAFLDIPREWLNRKELLSQKTMIDNVFKPAERFSDDWEYGISDTTKDRARGGIGIVFNIVKHNINKEERVDDMMKQEVKKSYKKDEIASKLKQIITIGDYYRTIEDFKREMGINSNKYRIESLRKILTQAINVINKEGYYNISNLKLSAKKQTIFFKVREADKTTDVEENLSYTFANANDIVYVADTCDNLLEVDTDTEIADTVENVNTTSIVDEEKSVEQQEVEQQEVEETSNVVYRPTIYKYLVNYVLMVYKRTLFGNKKLCFSQYTHFEVESDNSDDVMEEIKAKFENDKTNIVLTDGYEIEFKSSIDGKIPVNPFH